MCSKPYKWENSNDLSHPQDVEIVKTDAYRSQKDKNNLNIQK